MDRRPLLSLAIGVSARFEAVSTRRARYEDVVEQIFRLGTVVSGALRVGEPGADRLRSIPGMSVGLRGNLGSARRICIRNRNRISAHALVPT